MKIDLVPFNPLEKVTAPAPATEKQPAAAPEPPPKPPTAAELKDRVKDNFSAMGWGDPSEAVQKAVADVVKPEEGAPAVAAPKPGEGAAAAPAAPAAEPIEELEVAPELSSQELIQQTASAVAAEVARAVRPEPQAPAGPGASPLEMVPEDEEIYRVVQWLEASNPAKYAGMSARFMDYIRKVYAYQDDWLAKNPGKNYDAGDEDHQEFYARNEFPITESEVSQAKIDMMVERRTEEKVAPLTAKVTAMEDERRIQSAQPQIASQCGRMVYRLVEMTNPELAKLLKDDKGNVSFADDRLNAVDAADPIAKSVLDDTANALQPLILELERTHVPGVSYKLSPNTNPVHAEIVRYQEKAERDMAKAPAEVRNQNGQQWVTVARMAALRTAIANSRGSVEEKRAKMDDLNARHWCLTVDHVEELIVHDFAERAKKTIETADKLGRKKYGGGENRPAAPAATPPAAAPVAAPVAPAFSNGKPRSPSTSSASDVVNTPGNGLPGAKSFGEEVSSVLFS